MSDQSKLQFIWRSVLSKYGIGKEAVKQSDIVDDSSGRLEDFIAIINHNKKDVKGDLPPNIIKNRTYTTGSTLKNHIRNEIQHKYFMDNIGSKLHILKVYETIEELKKDYYIDDFLDLKRKVESGNSSSREEKERIAICNENYIIYAIKREILKKDEDGNTLLDENQEPIVISKGGAKTLGVVMPSMHDMKFEYEEKIIIGNGVVKDIFSSKTLNGLSNKDLTSSQKLNILLSYMESHDISDLHITMHDEEDYIITARQNTKIIQVKLSDADELKEGQSALIDKKTAFDIMNKITIESKRGQLREFNDDEIRSLLTKTTEVGGKRNYRVHIAHTSINNIRGYTLSLRRLAKEEELKNFEGLGYSKPADLIMRSVLAKNESGLIIISGKVNSGKTTLLNAIFKLLVSLNRRGQRVENPAEVNITGISATYDLMLYKDAKKPLTLLDCTEKLVKSQDIDWVSLGETRQPAEKKAAVDLSMTGHLTLVTTHNSDNETAIADYESAAGEFKPQFKENLKMAINQKLVLKKCQACDTWESGHKKCNVCGGSRASGVLPVYDIIVFFKLRSTDDTSDIEKLEQEGKAFRIRKEQILEYYKSKNLIDSDDDLNGIHSNIDEYLDIKEHEIESLLSEMAK